MNRNRMLTIGIALLWLPLLGVLAISAQDAGPSKYTVKVPGGLAFSEFEGYEAWQTVSISRNDRVVAAILGNAVMIDAYRAGIPGNGKPVPDGAKMAKVHWKPKQNQFFPDATVPGDLVNVDFMVKDDKRFADSGGWGYAVFDYNIASDTFTPGTAAGTPPHYVGRVFKQEERGGDPRNACCAAQMFLASGDGVVFKGAVGPWYSPIIGDSHVTTAAAHDLVLKAIKAYRGANNQTPPRELFLHGRVKFNREEWRGFEQAANATNTAVVGVRIRDASAIKLYRWGDNPVLRGTALVQDNHSAFLWTRRWTPRLQTYVGRGVPNPLSVDVTHGKANLRTVLQDVLALTKVNYNACVFADGVPITLKLADSVGEVLTAGPVAPDVPLPFMYYI